MQGHGLMQAIARTNRIWKDKPGGLIVDYIGIGEEIKKAIRQYTRDAGAEREPVDTSGEALRILLDTLDVIRKELFHGFDYAGYADPKKALSLLGPAMEHILSVEPELDFRSQPCLVISVSDTIKPTSHGSNICIPCGVMPIVCKSPALAANHSWIGTPRRLSHLLSQDRRGHLVR